jgi:hypothetical protein
MICIPVYLGKHIRIWNLPYLNIKEPGRERSGRREGGRRDRGEKKRQGNKTTTREKHEGGTRENSEWERGGKERKERDMRGGEGERVKMNRSFWRGDRGGREARGLNRGQGMGGEKKNEGISGIRRWVTGRKAESGEGGERRRGEIERGEVGTGRINGGEWGEEKERERRLADWKRQVRWERMGERGEERGGRKVCFLAGPPKSQKSLFLQYL